MVANQSLLSLSFSFLKKTDLLNILARDSGQKYYLNITTYFLPIHAYMVCMYACICVYMTGYMYTRVLVHVEDRGSSSITLQTKFTEVGILGNWSLLIGLG